MRVRSAISTVVGCVLLLGAWELLGRRALLGSTFPPLSAVLKVLGDGPRAALLLRATLATVGSAGEGFILGTVLGAAAALLAHLVPVLRTGLDRLAVLVNALPVIALAPVLIITAGRAGAPAALASVPVFFLLYTATATGLRRVSPPLDMMLLTLGAGRWQRLLKFQAIAALPEVVTGMKVATSSAMIGAIVGEWFGAPSGLGVVVLNSMQNFQIPLLWATVMVIAAITLSSYGLLTIGERAVRARIGECDA
jgi:ABC-type nitrate/sulfonate/bicarbonate transport system permease component